jgi:hypothetical protein
LLLGCATLLGCSPVVDAKFSQIEVSRLDVPVPAAPSGALAVVDFQFYLSSGQLGASSNPSNQSLIRSVELEQLALTAESGITDLSFIATLHAVAFVPLSKSTLQETSRQVEIADYKRGHDSGVGSTFDVPLPEPVDLLPLLRPSGTESSTIVVSMSLGGQLPTVSWTTNIGMALSVDVGE